MKQIRIREAVLADVPTLLGFEQSLIDAERPFETNFLDHKFVYYDLDALISSSSSALLVAELSNELVGSGYARIESSKPWLKHKQHCYLGFIYVDPAARGRKIGTLIIEKLMHWSQAQGVTETTLNVYSENIPAIRVYEKMGFSKQHLLMRMSLDDSNAKK